MKKTALILLKILVAGVLLWYIFKFKTDPAKLWREMKNADPAWLVLAFLVNFSILFLAVWRWNLLLKVQGISARFYPVFWAICAGNFFNSFLLGLTGGDIARVYYATQLAPSKKVGAGLSIVVDRLVGMLGLMVLAGLVIVFFGHTFWDNAETRRWVLIIAASIGVASMAVALYLKQRMVGRWIGWERWRHRLPLQKVLEHLNQINEAYHNNQRTLLNTVLISVLVHILSILAVYLIGRSLQIEAPMIAFYLVLPIINAVTAIPLSPGGVGVREYMFLLLFNAIGVHANAKVTAMSFLYYFGVIVLTSIAAGVIYLFARPAAIHHEKISEIIAHEEENVQA